jgi:hypothetical protein
VRRLLLLVSLAISLAACGEMDGISPDPTASASRATKPPEPTGTEATTPWPASTRSSTACSAPPASEPGRDPDAVPAIEGLLEAARQYPYVAVGEIHGSAGLHALLADLLCDPRFPKAVGAIVVEFGSARYQEVLDQYIAGETVDPDALAAVWRDTTQSSGTWSSSLYSGFYARVRFVNESLPDSDRIRVLAGDPPIDNGQITNRGACDERQPTCLDHWLFQRDEHMAATAQLARAGTDRSVLIVAGVGHVIRRLHPEHPPSIPQLIEAETGERVAVVIPHVNFRGSDTAELSDRFRQWPTPGFAWTADGWLADLPACLIEDDLPESGGECHSGSPGPRIADLADAYLHLGR